MFRREEALRWSVPANVCNIPRQVTGLMMVQKERERKLARGGDAPQASSVARLAKQIAW
jgi:hypothetical protein